MNRAIAFIPEVRFDIGADHSVSIAPGLSVISPNHSEALRLRSVIENAGSSISGGLYLSFDGTVQGDGTIYEVFQSYCLALTFFYEGRANCRAMQEINESEANQVQFFIDEYDKFRYDPDDERAIHKEDLQAIAQIYARVSGELASKEFNPLRNSIEFFTFFLKEVQIRIRLLYLNICLESLFLGGSETEGISYKLGMRCSHLLTANDKSIKKQETFDEVKNGYDLRSKIIHGSDFKKASEKILKRSQNLRSELDHVLVLEKIVKRAYKIILSDLEYYRSSQAANLGTQIDKEIILNANH